MAAREESAAGIFYPKERNRLRAKIDSLLKNTPKAEKSGCVIAPHAGYEYSGKTAAYSFKALRKACTIVMIGPNHTGLGKPISISNSEYWKTPLGKTGIDKTKRAFILEKMGIEADGLAHLGEHSLEVELPFLQALVPDAKILPITIMEHDFSELERLGNAIAGLGEISLVVSGDFTHYQPIETARKMDMGAIKFIEKLDGKGFYEEVSSKGLSICGFAPITAAIAYCRKTGLKKGRLLHYETSAESSGDRASVVGYSSIAFY